METSRKNEGWSSILGVILLALVLPALLKVANSIIRYTIGAEGRLSAITIETDRILGPLPKPWKAIAQGGENLKYFLDEAGTPAAQLQPEYIRIDHIYDEFDVVSRNGENLEFSFTELDKVVEKIKQIGAKPFLSLSYMPSAIASGDETSEPKNWQDWSLVVQKTVEHFSGETGIDEVYYEVWNEPDLFGGWKIGGKKDYRNLYMYAANGAAKASTSRNYKFGGPATTGLYRTWVSDFLEFVEKNNLRLDFISWHRYDLNLTHYREDITNAEKWIETHPKFGGVEKIITEIGPNPESGQQNDDQIGASHTVATARELMFNTRYAFYFSLTGKWGMVGKPRYFALEMLNRLGTNRLPLSGEGTWVKGIAATDGDKFQVILVNYDPDGKHMETVPVSFIKLPPGKYDMTTQILGAATTTMTSSTSEAILQTQIPLGANSVALVEVFPSAPSE